MEPSERIYLQISDEFGDPVDHTFNELTWCEDKINKDDIEYVRGDLFAQLEAENGELKDAATLLTRSLTDNDLEAVKAQWGVNINTVWNARNKLIALLAGKETP